MGTRVRGWRWRSNPLRRRSDVVEAWTALVVAVLLCVGAPVTGLVTGWRAYDGARDAAVEQRAERHRVRAEVTEQAPGTVPSAQGGKQPSYWVAVRWAEPGERPHTGEARVPAGTRPGDRTHVWLDDEGRIVAAPADSTAIWQRTFATGACATGGAASVVLIAHFVVRRVALRRRLAEWEREWARTGPEWGRRWA
ncbi:hypothetical protein G5C60_18035 [Streptomyces sp. HC44]|uniref:Integral membrane protein n=1 Tax=Streptomyces scabichelini TaxID=2711217 RepID=A0A6G4V6A0_9ACTN|nr:hypothetical protein [Streptomyces scabichelini]NGO09445.1 hypothetical protein [Streptomyces scabichelini]